MPDAASAAQRDPRAERRAARTASPRSRSTTPPTHTVITAQQRPAPLEGWFPEPVEVRIDRRVWARASTTRRPPAAPARRLDRRRDHRRPAGVGRTARAAAELLRVDHRQPRPARLALRPPPLRKLGASPQASRAETQRAPRNTATGATAKSSPHSGRGRSDTAERPGPEDWTRAQRTHPCSRSVSQHYGTFRAAVLAAGLTPA